MVSPNKSNTHRDGVEHGASLVSGVIYFGAGGKLRHGLFGRGEKGAPATIVNSAREGRASESGSGEENDAQEGHGEHTDEGGMEGLTKWFERGERAFILKTAARCI
jgi:hypothetical protein